MTKTMTKPEFTFRALPQAKDAFPPLHREVDELISCHALEAAKQLGPRLRGLPPVAARDVLLRAGFELWDALRGEPVVIGQLPAVRFDAYCAGTPSIGNAPQDALVRLLAALLSAGSARATLARQRDALDAAIAELPEV